MSSKSLTCIGCPFGCMLLADVLPDGTINVSGNNCKHGAEYAKKELTDPRRVLTTTVRVIDGALPLIPVKTKGDIPKKLMLDLMHTLKGISVHAPIALGDTIIEDICGTGISVIATMSMREAR